jgi:ferredoxin-NADP reductase
MEIAISIVALVFLAALSLYLLMALANSVKRSASAGGSAVIEEQRLRAEIDRIMDHTRFERETNELSWNGFRKFNISRKAPEGGGICSFYFSPHDGKPLPPFKPGQYLTFGLDIAGQKKQVIRCYSLSDSPHHPDYYRCSIKAVPAPRDMPDVAPGLSSNHFHDSVNEGDILDIKAPGGHFFMDTTKQSPVVLIGGGIGLTPVLSMLNQIVESGSKRETWFFYGVRDSNEQVMKEHLEQIAQENENVHMCVCYSRPQETDVEGKDYQYAERVSVDLFKRILPSNNYDFYMCGPPPMMNTIVPALEEWKVPEKHIHFEAFGPATVKKTKTEANKEATSASAASAGVQIVFAKSGKTLDWDPEIGSILDFAEENEIDIDFGCRAGNCGTCITAIKEGEVDYLNEPGAEPESGSCLACISVPKGNLSIDA